MVFPEDPEPQGPEKGQGTGSYVQPRFCFVWLQRTLAKVVPFFNLATHPLFLGTFGAPVRTNE